MPREDDEMRRTVDTFTEFINEINHRSKEVKKVPSSLKPKRGRTLKLRTLSSRNEKRS
jgi:hypothetical protein